jgi:transposase-like protein
MTGRHAGSLRVALASHEAGRGKRYPRELKARIIEFARARREDGTSWAQIAEDLGIAFETVRRWCLAAEPATPRSMVPVRVVADGADRTVTIGSPAGYRIEGLTLREAVAVLRALG